MKKNEVRSTIFLNEVNTNGICYFFLSFLAMYSVGKYRLLKKIIIRERETQLHQRACWNKGDFKILYQSDRTAVFWRRNFPQFRICLRSY